MNIIAISVVIVSYNNLQILIDCIDSIFRFNDIGEKLEVIVVENSPSHEIYNHIKNDYGNVIVIKNNNQGFGQANNVGAKIAKGEYIIFLNPDTILVEPIFDFTIQKFHENHQLSLFGVKLVDEKNEGNMSFYFIDKHGFWAGQLIKILNKFNFFINKNMYISGANMFIRKKEFFEAGMFDENIFMYYEEPDLIKRIKSNGGKIAFYKTKKIIHLEGKTSGASESTLRRRLESAKYYSSKYNLDFKKQIKSEIRYNAIKYSIYNLFKNDSKKRTLSIINIFKEYYRNDI